ncbi:MAG TPA: 30S ribosomal protein S7 [Acidobacteriota bacterium]|jgi:small subunit ribosomal protein S7|nr:30S ribosomal protein S7 [Acidobacteriota bacterium]HNT16486.1 30S ribosomal protein S7 [Acidobacteriota bacterium]HPA27870.1 30S ribosomal protein S7 [Acidobacteriota bacterium]HQO20568.1 30S ribosomal protein S7 [Acidobacteriota bacterium]HQQ47046.1 30S ribosomal protein S7 [Acidobacteriota bacterium]
MPRKAYVAKREVPPDPLYGSTLITTIVNKIMVQGKKAVAESIVYGALDIIKNKKNDDPLKILHKAIDNVKPNLEVKSRRVGGATYQVPIEVRADRKLSLALRWIIENARKKKEKTMMANLASELMDAYEEKGDSIKKRDDTHKMAEANKAFAHYRW